MKLVSFNIQHCRDYITKEINYDLFVNVIKQMDPDVIVLNEIYGEGSVKYPDQVRLFAERLELNYYFAKAINIANGSFGNAILSKYKIENPETIKISDPLVKDEDCYYESRCIAKATINGLLVIGVHMGLAKAEEKNAVNKILEIIKDIDSPFVIMGDFNMMPDSPILKPLLEKAIDTLKYLKREEYSYPSINGVDRRDYILASKSILIIDAKIMPYVASDHLPHYAKISF